MMPVKVRFPPKTDASDCAALHGHLILVRPRLRELVRGLHPQQRLAFRLSPAESKISAKPLAGMNREARMQLDCHW
jgi:hypothetical protein